jgi:hypothetical protein
MAGHIPRNIPLFDCPRSEKLLIGVEIDLAG